MHTIMSIYKYEKQDNIVYLICFDDYSAVELGLNCKIKIVYLKCYKDRCYSVVNKLKKEHGIVKVSRSIYKIKTNQTIKNLLYIATNHKYESLKNIYISVYEYHNLQRTIKKHLVTHKTTRVNDTVLQTLTRMFTQRA